MRSFIALAVRRRVAVLMTALAVTAFGIVGYQRLALDLLPDISYPSLTVQTDFPDTAPAEVRFPGGETLAEAQLRAAQTFETIAAQFTPADTIACFTHGVLSGPAVERLRSSGLERVLVTNTIPVDSRKITEGRLKVLSIAGLLGEAIQRIHTNSSVSSLFV